MSAAIAAVNLMLERGSIINLTLESSLTAILSTKIKVVTAKMSSTLHAELGHNSQHLTQDRHLQITFACSYILQQSLLLQG